jgi:hypothetical protein
MLTTFACACATLRLGLAFVLLGALSDGAVGQSSTLAAITPPAITTGTISNAVRLPEAPIAHKFCDRGNRLLFFAVGALNTADFAVTRNNLANGGRELNPLVRPFAGSTAGLAANFSAQTAGAIGISYIFHRTGHHRLERITPLVNIAGSAVAVGYGLAHR